MKSSVNIISARLIIFCLFAFAFSATAQSDAITKRVTREMIKNYPTETLTSVEQEKKAIADLDTQYQHAVKVNDAATMARILADDFILVTGKGKVFTKEDLLQEAREGGTTYERQEDTDQTVRVWGDTAIITALLWVKGSSQGKSFEYRLWFSDVYKRTPDGWRYVFAQAAQPLAQAQRPNEKGE